MEVKAGKLNASKRRFGIVVARFNDFVTGKLLEGAVDTLVRMGAAEGDITVVWVPGAFEIPVAAARLARGGKVDAVICLGTVIRGQTPHFDYVAGQCASGIAAISLETGLPVILGVLTTETMEQAIDRAGGKMGNKGAEAAEAAVEMADLLGQL
ncbi:MAG TPA: 6,7-dimethyl-8-ribityllumazine synthase [Candidatus Dormibacteraeota bacterium]|jgi:6,7-dimethyl-8-ribityllumazine synthase|nr:6,7-dimethyl-8-ribityllumazine synthase [Candidatus Dormibacteraeota bacterium]